MHTTADATPTRALPRFWPSGVLFVVVPWLISQIPGTAVFALNPNAAADIGLTRVPVPPWVFIVAWMIIHPSMGVAGWRLWRAAHNIDVGVPLALLAVGVLQTNFFWFTDSLRATAVTDATGMMLAVTTLWAFSRYSRTAARWLWPWAIWMPLTLALKIAVIAGAL